MDKVFKHLLDKSVEVHMNDMIVKSSSSTQHSMDLSEVFSTL